MKKSLPISTHTSELAPTRRETPESSGRYLSSPGQRSTTKVDVRRKPIEFRFRSAMIRLACHRYCQPLKPALMGTYISEQL